jgi:hypothetical protein
MAGILRNRFVALDLAEGWIELTRTPRWTLSPIDGAASLSLTIFPVAEGVLMNLATLRVLEHERNEADARRQRVVHRGGAAFRAFFVDETTWTEGRLFCLASTRRLDFEPPGDRRIRGLERQWTVSDGKHVLQATLWTEIDAAFDRALAPCEGMMHSVRFEGPS